MAQYYVLYLWSNQGYWCGLLIFCLTCLIGTLELYYNIILICGLRSYYHPLSEVDTREFQRVSWNPFSTSWWDIYQFFLELKSLFEPKKHLLHATLLCASLYCIITWNWCTVSPMHPYCLNAITVINTFVIIIKTWHLNNRKKNLTNPYFSSIDKLNFDEKLDIRYITVTHENSTPIINLATLITVKYCKNWLFTLLLKISALFYTSNGAHNAGAYSLKVLLIKYIDKTKNSLNSSNFSFINISCHMVYVSPCYGHLWAI